MIDFRCDLAQQGTPLPHVWETCIGSGHAPLGLRADWQAQLARCRDELGVRYVRFHGLLSDDMYTLTEQEDELVYSFFNADQIFDFLVGIGMKPFVELSFMPRALASGNATVFSYAGNITPPEDYEKWATLIETIVRHWTERYGLEEVRTWFFEVWNEPNLRAFWSGSQADYFELYRHTAKAVKKVDDALRVGGPATAKNEWIEETVAFCEREKLPLDFVSTHHYPTDAFGEPGDDTEEQLASGTRGVLREQAQDAVRRAAGRPVYYTEWNTSSNPFFHRHDTPYAAAFLMKSWLDMAGLVEGYSYWTFSDIFEENYFSSVPFHGGFGLLTIHGIAKPTYRAADLLHRAGDVHLLVDGLHPTVNAWVTRAEDRLVVLLTNHALPKHDIADERVRFTLVNAPKPKAAFVERIDADHANPHRLWETMGEPGYLSAEQVDQLHGASELVREPHPWTFDDGTLTVELGLPAHAVAALTIEL